MKRVLFLLFVSTFLARAQGPDQDYIQIYNLIEQADTLKQNGQTRAAVENYREAENALKRLQTSYPQWNENVIKFRIGYVADKLQSLGQPSGTIPAVSAPVSVAAPAKMPIQNDASIAEVRRLQSEKAMLEAKLKEALSAQPNIAASSELAKNEERMASLEKERDLLKVALDHEKKVNQEQLSEAGIAELAKLKQLEQEKDELQKKLALADVSAKNTAPAGERVKEIAQLQARIQALEAKPDPYTPEELALFKQPAPQLATAQPAPNKKSKVLPPGVGALVAQAERSFNAREFAEAEKIYLEILRQDEDNVYILGNLAATQLELNHLDDVEKNLKHALSVEPDDSFCLTLLGMTKFREDKFDESLDLLSRSVKINPENPETQNYLGITLSQKGQRTAAEAALRKAIKLQPNYAGAHHNLAVIYATQRPPYLELARWHYERSLALGHPKNPDLEKLLGETK